MPSMPPGAAAGFSSGCSAIMASVVIICAAGDLSGIQDAHFQHVAVFAGGGAVAFVAFEAVHFDENINKYPTVAPEGKQKWLRIIAIMLRPRVSYQTYLKPNG